MSYVNFTVCFLLLIGSVSAQTPTDTSFTHEAHPVIIESRRNKSDIIRLPSIDGTYIHSGKKSEVINLTEKNLGISEKYGRQIFAKIPGVFVYDMDGTGNQMNISTRGLDPHRGWEFNIRKDGIITNSDMYGYPASHYNIPMEAVERIELVRGTGSLQYGAQFGGMLNYISKQPDSIKQVAFEAIISVGSYGLVSNYARLSGTMGKFRYSAWINKKSLDGYRDNSDSDFQSAEVALYYQPSSKLKIKIDWTYSDYTIRLAGPLTDSMLIVNPRMATRSRNYYNPIIHVPSISIDYSVSEYTKVHLSSSAILGDRNSVIFDKPATIADTIVSSTLNYNRRQVDIDNFNSYTAEVRLLHSYNLLGKKSTFTTGIQYMNNKTHRRQQGRGSEGSDYDLSLVVPGWGRDLFFATKNIAFFVENKWQLTTKLSVNTGLRYESGKSDLSGEISYYEDEKVPNSLRHEFPLFGANLQYDFSELINLYAGWSQAYRSVLFKDIVPQSVFERTDNELKDAFGYNGELGFRGTWKYIKWDVSGFILQYNNRIGTLAQTDTSGNLTIFRTNIGNSLNKGLEVFLQGDFYSKKKFKVSVFTSTSLMEARYTKGTVVSQNINEDIAGKRVESVPLLITRNGLTFKYSGLSCSVLYSFVSESYADPLNTVKPSASGAVGLVPEYSLVDLNIGIRLSENINLLLNANNLLDKQYFTKRPQFYPGPGIWPSDGRTFSGSVVIRI